MKRTKPEAHLIFRTLAEIIERRDNVKINFELELKEHEKEEIHK